MSKLNLFFILKDEVLFLKMYSVHGYNLDKIWFEFHADLYHLKLPQVSSPTLRYNFRVIIIFFRPGLERFKIQNFNRKIDIFIEKIDVKFH